MSVFLKTGYPIIWMKGHFYVWNGVHYSVIENDRDFQSFLRVAGRRTGLPKHVIEDADFLIKLQEQFMSKCCAAISEKNRGKILVNLLNCTLEIDEEGGVQMRPHDPDDLLTYVLPFCYDPNAKAPLWTKHMNMVLPDISSQKLLAEHLGYAFIPTSKLKLEKVLVLYGEGANGKSVIHDVITKLLGADNITHYSLDHLCDKTGYYRAMIDGKLLNYCSEISPKMSVEYFKKLASGEPVDVRSVYEKPYLMSDYAKLMFNCNELPWTLEHHLSFFRRLDIIRFEIIIAEALQDKEFANKIIANELTGVFNWVLDGMTRLVKQRKFTPCKLAEEQILQYKKESDSIQLFLDESGYVKDNQETLLTDDLYRRYDNYCNEFRHKHCSKMTFAKRLRVLGFEFKRNSRASYIYITQDGNPSIGL